ncbi:MAG: hypothetical protein ACRETD_01695, partial [Steroidobacteraceae bacterium]
MRIALWPQSLFGRLIAASVLAVLLAELFAFALIARERELFVLQGNVREWSRRIAEITFMLQPLSASEREVTISRLIEHPWRFARPAWGGGSRRARRAQGLGLPPAGSPMDGTSPPHGRSLDPTPLPPSDEPPDSLPAAASAEADWLRTNRPGVSSQLVFIPLPLSPDFEPTLKQQLRSLLGTAYQVSIAPTSDVAKRAIPIQSLLFEPRAGSVVQLFDIDVGFPDGGAAVFRIGHMPRGAPLSRNLFINLALLVAVLVIALYVTARSIT